MKRKRIVFYPGDDETREEAINVRRLLISRVVSVDTQAAGALPLSPATVDRRARWICTIRRIERDWKLKPWNPQLATASIERQALEWDSWPAELMDAPLRSDQRCERVNVEEPDRRITVYAKGPRVPLLTRLVRWFMEPSSFFDSILDEIALGNDAGHDLGGALITATGQTATGPDIRPVGQDAFLIYCRNCRRAIWLDLPPEWGDGEEYIARIFELGGPCPMPAAAAHAPGQAAGD